MKKKFLGGAIAGIVLVGGIIFAAGHIDAPADRLDQQAAYFLIYIPGSKRPPIAKPQ